MDYESGYNELGVKIPPLHVGHCLDSLRQDIMCVGDDTPMPSLKPRHGTGDGQMMQCKDLNKVAAWAKEPERDACYRHIDDYHGIAHAMERFAYCAEDSPYYSTMKAYFDYQGHEDPFE